MFHLNRHLESGIQANLLYFDNYDSYCCSRETVMKSFMIRIAVLSSPIPTIY